MNANLTALRAFYYDVLLLTTAYSACAVRFFLGQFPNMELLLLLLSLYYLLNSLYFPGWWNITLFLTGCLCALNYMSKPDHLIYWNIITLFVLIACIIHTFFSDAISLFANFYLEIYAALTYHLCLQLLNESNWFDSTNTTFWVYVLFSTPRARRITYENEV